MKLGTPRANQGQIVEISFGWCDGRLYRHTFDQSDRTELWDVADKDESNEVPESYDPGGDDYGPPGVKTWMPCAAPVEDEYGAESEAEYDV